MSTFLYIKIDEKKKKKKKKGIAKSVMNLGKDFNLQCGKWCSDNCTIMMLRERVY